MEERAPKQVIVMRTDLKCRKGKLIAQGAHAAGAWESHLILGAIECARRGLPVDMRAELTEAQRAWLEGIFTKVCCRVDSEAELLEIERKAKEAGLMVHLITDCGLTEFHGVPTKTCLAIGPDWPENIDPITGHLPLY